MITTIDAAAKPITLVALGDSLTAGYGLAQSEAFPVVLEKRLKELGLDVTVINGGVSGDTASGGLERLDWTVPEGTHGVIVELGANDALRGIDPAITRESLRQIIERLQARGIRVMLAGMLAPRNMGAEYATAFDAIYPALAAEFNVPLYPFFLDGVAADTALLLPDGLHPTAEGIERIVARMLPSVQTFVSSIP
jgi:acyl-CoA thioesterase-1